MSGLGQPRNEDSLGVVGCTATGKSGVALWLAQRLGGEILSVDSMQVYRGLDIGTAKPTLEERAAVPHHLIDVVPLEEAFDAARFIAMASTARDGIEGRGRKAIFCGGTGLYFRAFASGLGTAPGTDTAIRGELERTPLPVLLEELKARDPTAYDWIDRRNPRRVIRALEVIRVTGRPFSQQRSDWEDRDRDLKKARLRLIGIRRAPEDLRRRIDQRVESMFSEGLVQETRQLVLEGLKDNPVARMAIGYREALEFLAGERSLDETIGLVKVRTWQFAKRQTTWFRHQLPVTWIEAGADEPCEALGQRALMAMGWA